MALEPITRQEKIIAGQDLTPITRMEKFLKQYGGGSGGGSGGVTSWNDLTDKPFGEVTTVKEVLAECQPEFNADSNGFDFDKALELSVGEKYTVNWNGVDFECVCGKVEADGSTIIVLGNAGALMGGEDTGEPFVVVSYPGDEGTDSPAAAAPLDGSTTLTISIRQEVTEVKKISGKYVEGMGYEEDGVVHPIDQQFLPSVGGQFVVTLTMGATGVVSDKTGVEIGEAAKNGSVAIAILNVNESLFVFTLQGFSADEAFATFGRFVLNDGDLSYESVTIQADGTVSMGGAKVQTT